MDKSNKPTNPTKVCGGKGHLLKNLGTRTLRSIVSQTNSDGNCGGMLPGAVEDAMKRMDIGLDILRSEFRSNGHARGKKYVLKLIAEMAAGARLVFELGHLAYNDLLTVLQKPVLISGKGDDTTAKVLELVQLQTEAWLTTLNGYAIDTTVTELRLHNHQLNATGQICFPVAMAAHLGRDHLPKSINLLKHSSLLQVGYYLEAEQEFIDMISESELSKEEGATVHWTPLDDVSREVFCGRGSRFVLPGTRQGQMGLYKRWDIFDKYVRQREHYMRELKWKVIGLKSENSVDLLELGLALAFCQQELETGLAPVLTVKYESTEDILTKYPERELVNEVVGKWARETFDSDALHVYMSDELFYDCQNYIYSFIRQTDVLIEIGKCAVFGPYIDTVMEECPTFALALCEACDYAENGSAAQFPPDNFQPSVGSIDWPSKYVHALRALVKICHKMAELGIDNFPYYWRRWGLWVKETHSSHTRNYMTLEQYFEDRVLDIGGDIFNNVIAQCMGTKMEDIPEWVIRETSIFIVIENDLFSYGKELVEVDFVHSRILSCVELVKSLHPALSFQGVFFELEALRDQLYVQYVRKCKGTVHHNWYHQTAGLRHFTLKARRYAHRHIISNGSILVKIGSGLDSEPTTRRDACIVAPLIEKARGTIPSDPTDINANNHDCKL